jgi:hypothetical protein
MEPGPALTVATAYARGVINGALFRDERVGSDAGSLAPVTRAAAAVSFDSWTVVLFSHRSGTAAGRT